MSRRVLLDTGPLVALLSKRDQHHSRCHELAKTLPAQLFTSGPVITEASYLISKQGGQSPRPILGMIRAGQLVVLPLEKDDYLGIDDILNRYSDQEFSLADASLMFLAEREGIEEIFTVDAKDFSVFRTSEGGALSILA